MSTSILSNTNILYAVAGSVGVLALAAGGMVFANHCMTGLNAQAAAAPAVQVQSSQSAVNLMTIAVPCGILFAGYQLLDFCGCNFWSDQPDQPQMSTDERGLSPSQVAVRSRGGRFSTDDIPTLENMLSELLAVISKMQSADQDVPYHVYNNVTSIREEIQKRRTVQKQPIQRFPSSSTTEGGAAGNANATKFALMVSLNYTGKERLDATDDDCIRMHTFLKENGFDHLVWMNDGQDQIPVEYRRNSKSPLYTNKENVLAQLGILIEKANAVSGKSVIFFYYSGHGYGNKTEQCLVLSNAAGGATINPQETVYDKDLTEQFANKIPSNCEAYAMFDCCHSGTLIDLPYKLTENKVTKSYEWSPNLEADRIVAKKHDSANGPGKLIYLSGCGEVETAKEICCRDHKGNVTKQAGAMTDNFLQKLEEESDMNLTNFFKFICNAVKIRKQVPQMSANFQPPSDYTYKNCIDGKRRRRRLSA